MSDEQGPEPSEAPATCALPSDISDTYDRMREQVRTENDLYNQRIIWLVSMNAFLFATVGLILQAKFNGGAGKSVTAAFTVEDVLDVFLIVFSIVGGLVSCIAQGLLHGANKARNQVGRMWDDYTSGIEAAARRAGYPHVLGGRDGKNKTNKFQNSDNLPWLFVATWVVFAVLIVVLMGARH